MLKTFASNIYFFLIFLLISRITCYGQSLILNDIKNSQWISSSDINDSTISKFNKIPLSRLRISKDSLKENVIIWRFIDEYLLIEYYNSDFKTDSLIAKYKYYLKENNTLKIKLYDNITLEYNIGMVSTGNFLLLIKKKT